MENHIFRSERRRRRRRPHAHPTIKLACYSEKYEGKMTALHVYICRSVFRSIFSYFALHVFLECTIYTYQCNVILVRFWCASVVYQASLVESSHDAHFGETYGETQLTVVLPKYPWRDQTRLI